MVNGAEVPYQVQIYGAIPLVKRLGNCPERTRLLVWVVNSLVGGPSGLDYPSGLGYSIGFGWVGLEDWVILVDWVRMA